ncbi:MAG: hypothetical protein JOS17DRAFT_476889 [Linnemannia elongata]|nr:MAG: hypothetical protein JOS17DRAFT_476889 [Linnemannia elongata]
MLLFAYSLLQVWSYLAGFIVYWCLITIVHFCISSSFRACRSPLTFPPSSSCLSAPAPSMAIAAYLILATSIAAIAAIYHYLVDNSVDPRPPHNATPTIPPRAVERRRTLHSNPTSASVTAARNSTQPAYNIPAPNIPVRNIRAPIPAPVARKEIDGLFLHEAVAAEVDDRYPYDQEINTERKSHSTKLVAGYFKCYSCKPKKYQPDEPRTWLSYGICVEIWMSPSSGTRYRTRLHSQMCANCYTVVEPEVIKDDYVTVIVKVLDRWTGQQSTVKPRQKYGKTGPHKTDKCNACQKGISPPQASKVA